MINANTTLFPYRTNAEAPSIPQIPLGPGSYAQHITYPCGCEMWGYAPMPIDCETHGAYNPSLQPVQEPEKQEILLSLVLDESGSMETNKAKTIDALNEYLKGLESDAKTDYTVTLTKFDTVHGEPTCRVLYKMQPLKSAPRLSPENYTPRGSTPLCDAVGQTARWMEPESKGKPVLMVIVSDGYENASLEFTKESIKKLIDEKEKAGNWTFVYLGADINAWAAAAAIGINPLYAAAYNSANVANTMSAMSNLTKAYSVTRSMMPMEASLRCTSFTFSDPSGGLVGDLSSSGSNLTSPQTTSPIPDATYTIADMQQAAVAGRREKLTPAQRVEIAKKGAAARWKSKK